MKNILRTILFFSLILIAGVVQARVENVTETVDMQGANKLVLDCELGAGEFSIKPDNIIEGAIIDIEYNSRNISYLIDPVIKGDRCFLNLESENRRKSNIDTEDNIWDITLSTRYETSLEMDIGACDAEFDLGGIPLKEMILDIGAASGEIRFSKPNPIRMETIDIDAGATSLEMTSVGNANFDNFIFSGGAGSFELDFRGEYKGHSEIEIEVGLGSVQIILPRGVACRVESEGDGWLSSVDLHNHDLEEIDDDIYESEDFDRAKDKITLNIEVGLGSIDIYWK